MHTDSFMSDKWDEDIQEFIHHTSTITSSSSSSPLKYPSPWPYASPPATKESPKSCHDDEQHATTSSNEGETTHPSVCVQASNGCTRRPATSGVSPSCETIKSSTHPSHPRKDKTRHGSMEDVFVQEREVALETRLRLRGTSTRYSVFPYHSQGATLTNLAQTTHPQKSHVDFTIESGLCPSPTKQSHQVLALSFEWD